MNVGRRFSTDIDVNVVSTRRLPKRMINHEMADVHG